MYEYNLGFELNDKQKENSEQVLDYYKNKNNILIDAVCGAGKTEILLATINHALNNNLKIGFACPRRQLTIELYTRIKEYYNESSFGLVVGYTSKNIESNLIFLTTHQLVKYEDYFDLLIIDEIDAFPFFDNHNLEKSALRSAKQFIYLSATVPEKYLNLVRKNKLKYVSNCTRHHQQLMPVPQIKQIKYGLLSYKLIRLCYKYKKNPLLIFVANIKSGYRLLKLLSKLKFKCEFVYSKNLNTDTLESLKLGELDMLITSTVLERGITLKKLNVIVYQADSFIFDTQTLIQICGRVGRDTVYYQGDVIFISNKISEDMIKTLETMRKYNEMQGV